MKIGSAGSVSRFGGLNNLAGISLGYDLERTGFSMGFNRVDFISTVRESDLLSRAGHYVDAAVSMRFPQRFLAGVEATAGLTDFTLDGRRDNLNWSAGLFGRWFLGDHIVVEPRVGVVGYRFSENTDEEGQPDLDFYAQLTLRHRMTEHLRHELRFSRETSSAGAADLERYHLLSWNWTWQMNERLTASLAAFADAGTDLGGLTQVSYSRWGIEPAVQLRLGPKISARASAQVVMKDSKLENQDYAARILSVGMSYAF